MPPRKKASKAQPALPPLHGCVVAISGTIRGRPHAAIERDLIVALGATLDKSITDATTHLVATETDYNKPSTKVVTAKSNKIPIVTIGWLEDSLEKMTRMDENAYAFVSAQPQSPQPQPSPEPSPEPSQPQPPLPNRSRKRTATQKSVDNDDKNDSQAKPQSRKKTKTIKTEANDEEAKEDEESKKPKKPKVADGQIAKSLDVRIPVDEGVERQSAGYEVYIAKDGVIYDASLNQTNATANNNKFYRLQV